MKAINTKYKVTAEVLTPLSIGQGAENDWVYGVDYLVQSAPNNPKQLLLYHLDLNKMVAAGINIGVLSNYLFANNVQGVLNLLKNSLNKVSDFCIPLPDGIGLNGLTNPIKTFLRNDLTNRPVLAGSSLKGALRSVLFTALRDSKEKENDNVTVFGSMKDGNDFMRFVRVGDFEFEKTCLVNTKIFNLQRGWEGGWKHGSNNTTANYSPIGFNTIYECLPPRATATGSIMLADTLFDRIAEQPHRAAKSKIMHSPITELCGMVNDHTFAYLDKEYDFFDKYEVDYTGNILNAIGDVQNVINACASNACVLKMSAGAGFHSITGDWQFKDFTGSDGHTLGQKSHGDLPKSRKLAVSGSRAFSLMGFVKLTFTKE